MSEAEDVALLNAVPAGTEVQPGRAPVRTAAPSAPGKRKHAQVLDAIYHAAIGEFASEGPARASAQAIADKAGLSKAQLYYYIESKEGLYRQVLKDIVDDLIGGCDFSRGACEPRRVLVELIHRKMVFSFEHPLRARILAAEVLRGAPVLRTMTDTSRQRTHQVAMMIQDWINNDLMAPADPMVFLLHLCAVTQFYADHAAQATFKGSVPQGDDRRQLIAQVTELVLKYAGVR
jgi:TetR/AcrR family transcriptional regulator